MHACFRISAVLGMLAVQGLAAFSGLGETADQKIIVRRSDRFCGLDAFALVSQYHGRSVSRLEAISLTRPSRGGVNTFSDLKAGFEKLGFHAVPVKCNAAALVKYKVPAVLHCGKEHFVTFLGISKDKYILASFSEGARLYSRSELRNQWDGLALFVFSEKDEERANDLLERFQPSTDHESSSADELAVGGSSPAQKAISRIDGKYGPLVFTPPLLRVRNLKQYQTYTCLFEYENTAQYPVQITGVKSSCKCSTPVWDKNEIKPGQKGKITFDLHIGSERDRQIYAIAVYVEGGTAKVVYPLKVLAECTLDLICDKPALNFLGVRPNERKTKILSLQMFEGSDYTLSRVDSSSSHILTEILPRRTDAALRDTLQVAVTLSDGIPAGLIDEKITLHFANNKRPPIVIPVEGVVLAN